MQCVEAMQTPIVKTAKPRLPNIRPSGLVALLALHDYRTDHRGASPTKKAWGELIGKNEDATRQVAEYLERENLVERIKGARYANLVPSELGMRYIARALRTRRLKVAA
jgi:hypothetical protein